jgi:hypothetical protein
MENERNVLVGICGCGKFVKVNSKDECISGIWIASHSLSSVLMVQLLLAKEVSGRVPISYCDECVRGLISGVLKQSILRTDRGVEVVTTYPKNRSSSEKS